ncbi:SDR family oxidoreductase [Streptomyces sp. SID486]|uniref:SDR family oxidoreductase n=1 Tax=Streptomyces sp. SID486 TaxID=2690264 RepID=UPI001372134A|nr:SDR family oxidoreductase [Streptomyces sp. SID486]MYX99068.1 SDR family oxidoreductase [Streptomyces sp. SID486]
MTKYTGLTAVVVGEATAIGLAVAKRLVEGGARVVLAARAAEERRRLGDELGSTARVVAPSGVAGCLASGDAVDLLFADVVATARPLLARVGDGGAVVLMTPALSPAAVHALAAELVSRGIRVNAVAPGCISAPGGAGVPLPPLGRLGAAEEVARAALFLATDATFTTGVRFPVDGGLSRP